MGLYLAVFDGTEEVEGVEVGSYEDFNTFRNAITRNLEGGVVGSRFPTLMLHPDSDGEWTPAEAAQLEEELEAIGRELCKIPPLEAQPEWRKQTAKLLGLRPGNLYESFFDVDGEPLVERLIGLAKISRERRLPILFQ